MDILAVSANRFRRWTTAGGVRLCHHHPMQSTPTDFETRHEATPRAEPRRPGKTVYYFAQSVDGFLADADGGLRWLLQPTGTGTVPGAADDPQTYDRFFAGVGAIAMGSRT
jgi:hypothetical protein